MSQQPRRIRRQPNFTAFLFSGALVGLVVGILVSVFGRTDARYEASVAMGFVGLISAGLGVLVAGVVAVLLDRRS